MKNVVLGAVLALTFAAPAMAADKPAMKPAMAAHHAMSHDDMMKRFDDFAGADKLMDKAEFMKMLAGTPMAKNADKSWDHLIKKYDADKDGKISRAEMEKHVNDMMSHKGGMMKHK